MLQVREFLTAFLADTDGQFCSSGGLDTGGRVADSATCAAAVTSSRRQKVKKALKIGKLGAELGVIRYLSELP
jgi:hypothetical protein